MMTYGKWAIFKLDGSFFSARQNLNGRLCQVKLRERAGTQLLEFPPFFLEGKFNLISEHMKTFFNYGS